MALLPPEVLWMMRRAQRITRTVSSVMEYLHHLTWGIGILGVVVICYGVLRGVISFLHIEWLALRRRNVDKDRQKLRYVLGYYILLGLEILIAADIIHTIARPTMEDLIVLGVIVAIRTVISYSLNAELKTEHRSDATP